MLHEYDAKMPVTVYTLLNSAALTLNIPPSTTSSLTRPTTVVHQRCRSSPPFSSGSAGDVYTIIEVWYGGYIDGDVIRSIFFAKSAEISVVGLQVRFPMQMEM